MKSHSALAGLVFALAALPAGAQSLTSFKDAFGDHIYYQGSPSQGSPNRFDDLYQLWPTGDMNIDMTQLPVSSNSGNPRPLVVGEATGGYDLASFVNARGQHLYYVDSNGHVRHLLVFWNGSKNIITNDDLTAMTGIPAAFGPLAAFSNTRGEHVYTIGANGHVLHLFWNGSKELAEDLSGMAKPSSLCATPAGRLISFGDGSTELVYYIGPNGVPPNFVGGHVCELAWYNGREGSYDLTLMSATPPAGDPNELAGFSDTNGQHVFYITGTQNLYVLNFTPSGTWRIADLSTSIGGNFVAWSTPGGNSLTSFANSLAEQVYYVDINQHVHEIDLTAWTQVDLTASLGGPPVTTKSSCGAPLAFIGSDDTSGEDVFYIGADQHVWELHNRNGAWSTYDLTSMFGGKPVAPCGGTADLAVQQSVLTYPKAYTNPFVYLVQVQNNGPDDAYNVELFTMAPQAWGAKSLDGIALSPSAAMVTPGALSCQPGFSSTGAPGLQCNLGKIPAGSSALVQVTWWTTDAFLPSDLVVTDAQVESPTTFDPNSPNNQSSLTLWID